MIGLLAVDFQREFTSREGRAFRDRPSVSFVREVLVPELRTLGLKTAEIVSDYRQPRHLDRESYCVPGTVGFESDLPGDVKRTPVWVKAHNHPAWIRRNGGALEPTDHPYSDAPAFHRWVRALFPDRSSVVVFGLTIDCCLICVSQELSHLGYDVRVLSEATDAYSGDPVEKRSILAGSPLRNWAEPIDWKTLSALLHNPPS